jgi:hypothetical protein
MTRHFVATTAFALAFSTSTPTGAVEIAIICSNALKSALEEIGPQCPRIGTFDLV